MMHSAATRSCFLVIILFLVAVPASATTVNVDIERSGDATHSGSDGALSGPGTVWNSVLAGTDAAALADDAGAATGVGIAFRSTMFETPVPFGDGLSTNDLQDSGVLGPGIDLLNLDPAGTYSLAVYGNVGGVVHGGGTAGACSRAAATYVLPGTEGADYCLYTDLTPFEVQPGVYGIQLTGPVMVAGLQLQGGSTVPDPPADTTPPECSMAEGSAGGSTVQIALVDGESGIAAIHVLMADNVTVSIPSFTPGTTDPVVVTASSDDATAVGVFELESEDNAGNSGVCNFEIASADPPPPPPDDGCGTMIEVLETAIREGTVTGLGRGNSAKGRLGAFRHMLVESCALWDAGRTQEACDMLAAAAKKCDGVDHPGDFITGEGTAGVLAAIAASPVATACWSSTPSMLQSASAPDLTIPVSWGLMKLLYDE